MSEFETKPTRGTKSATPNLDSSKLITDQRFRDTKTGLIGIQRETMLSSELQYLVNLLFISFCFFS